MCSLQAKQIEISIADQKLYLYDSGELVKEYIISSSKYGEGSEDGSFKTPLGKHKISKMIGGDQPHGMRFIGRIPSEIYPIYSEEKVLDRKSVV